MPQLTMACNKLHPLDLAYTIECSSLWMHHPQRQLRLIFSLRESLEAGLTLRI